MIMMFPDGITNCTTQVGDANNGEGNACVGAGSTYGKFLYLLLHMALNLKLL